MNFVRILCFVALAAVCAAVCFAPKIGAAQQAGTVQMSVDAKTGRFLTIDCENADVREVLRRYYSAIGKTAILSPDLKGTVSVNMRDHSAKDVLDYILAQAHALVEEQGDGVLVRPLTLDEMSEPRGRVDFDLKNVDVREALRAVFRRFDTTYSVDPNVTGTVSFKMRNVDIHTALRNLLGQVGATWEVQAGVYQILTQETAARPMRLTLDWSKSGFEAAIKDLAGNLGGTYRIDDGKGYVMDAHGRLIAVVSQSKIRR